MLSSHGNRTLFSSVIRSYYFVFQCCRSLCVADRKRNDMPRFFGVSFLSFGRVSTHTFPRTFPRPLKKYGPHIEIRPSKTRRAHSVVRNRFSNRQHDIKPYTYRTNKMKTNHSLIDSNSKSTTPTIMGGRYAVVRSTLAVHGRQQWYSPVARGSRLKNKK